ncbi:MAG TPA: hypothetical protein IAC31_03795 [Candidatus Faecousia intestinigallinarum]|nr:hypothetical protein [Candidatus Faecousia intestinigallinarum]
MKNLKRRLGALLTLALILLPLLALSVFASSAKQNFSFIHNGESTRYSSAVKNNIKVSGEAYMHAEVVVTGGDYLHVNQPTIWVDDYRGVTICSSVGGIGVGTHMLYYYGEAFDDYTNSKMTVNLASYSSGTLGNYGGYWYP